MAIPHQPCSQWQQPMLRIRHGHGPTGATLEGCCTKVSTPTALPRGWTLGAGSMSCCACWKFGSQSPPAWDKILWHLVLLSPTSSATKNTHSPVIYHMSHVLSSKYRGKYGSVSRHCCSLHPLWSSGSMSLRYWFYQLPNGCGRNWLPYGFETQVPLYIFFVGHLAYPTCLYT